MRRSRVVRMDNSLIEQIESYQRKNHLLRTADAAREIAQLLKKLNGRKIKKEIIF